MKHGGVDTTKQNDETWEGLLLSANTDFVSVLILWYSGVIVASTYAWMLPHTLEKYLKSYLIKSGKLNNKSAAEHGHDLKKLWATYKGFSNTTTSKPKLNEAFDEIIEEISTITTKQRYTGPIDFSSDTLLYFYIKLCSLLRYLIIGKQKYRNSLYGLDEYQFIPMLGKNNGISYGEMIVKKMLHLILEHGATFTNSGIVNGMEFKDYSISNTAILTKLDNCPACYKQDCSLQSLINFYRDIEIKD